MRAQTALALALALALPGCAAGTTKPALETSCAIARVACTLVEAACGVIGATAGGEASE